MLSKTLSTTDAGYGLQSITAKGYMEGDSQLIGIVPFSGTNYWDNQFCEYSVDDYNATCTGTAGLKSEYATGGAKYAGMPYPYVYDSSMSSVAPSTGGFGLTAQNNGYTIAYFVEEYMTKLVSMGLPNNSTGRLMSLEESMELGCSKVNNNKYTCSSAPTWLVDRAYWLGSARSNIFVWALTGSDIQPDGFGWTVYGGVRPVIEIPTSSFFES